MIAPYKKNNNGYFEITGKDKEGYIGVIREIDEVCPHCGEVMEELDTDLVSVPNTGGIVEWAIVCEHCGGEL